MKKTIQDLTQLRGKRVFVRVDFNVPLSDDGQVMDTTRIRETLPTLRALVEQGARLIVASHLGRPKGKVDDALRLSAVAEELQRELPDVPVRKVDEVVSAAVMEKANALKDGEILLLENLRFEPGEEKNDPELAKKLAALADVYVNDAFGAAHRAHASTEGITHYVQESVAGLLMAKEIEALERILTQPHRPFTAIIGGAKVSSKISVLKHLLDKVDNLVIGGGMAYTFLLGRGLSVGKSLVEPDFVEEARQLEEAAKQKGIQIILSQDLVVADRFGKDAKHQIVPVEAIPDDWEGMDIGPETRQRIRAVVEQSRSILWNGPLGVFEFPAFSEGTRAIAEAVVKATTNGAQTVLGGGDTLAAIELFRVPGSSFSHVSTGGGASLEFMEGKVLPGIAALNEKTAATV